MLIGPAQPASQSLNQRQRINSRRVDHVIAIQGLELPFFARHSRRKGSNMPMDMAPLKPLVNLTKLLLIRSELRFGAPRGIRTPDHLLRRQALFH